MGEGPTPSVVQPLQTKRPEVPASSREFILIRKAEQDKAVPLPPRLIERVALRGAEAPLFHAGAGGGGTVRIA
jgi:hypothetical protein